MTHFSQKKFTEQADAAVMLPIYIREVLGSNLGLVTANPE
jgi:hypothetical protein